MSATARFWVDVEGRKTHVRRRGSGPVALLLHQSPRSSAEYADLMAVLSSRYTVLAPDNPGNGLSDPFTDEAASIEAFGDHVAKLLDALKVKRVLVYGFHTGAAIGLAFASRHPKRVAAAVLNGVPVMDPEVAPAFAERYLPAFAPQWDGSHLAWLWARMREQSIFFPWFEASDDSRLAFDPPDAEAMVQSCIELLRAGDAYRCAYRAAFLMRTRALIARLAAPTLLVSADWDPLAPQMELLTAAPPLERLRLGVDRLAFLEPLQAFFARFAAVADSALAEPATHPLGFVGGLRAQRGDGVGRPLVLLHDHHDDANGDEIGAALSAHGDRPTLAVDLPGHGESEAPWPDDLAEAVDCVAAALVDTVGAGAELRGFGLGAGLAERLARRGIGALGPCRTARFAPNQHAAGARYLTEWARPQDHAGALMGAWRLARDGALFDPWCAPAAANARRPLGALDPGSLHRRAVAALKSRRAWTRAWAALAPDTAP